MLKSYNFPSVYEATNQELANVAENILDGLKINLDDTDYIVGNLALVEGYSPHKSINAAPTDEEYKLLSEGPEIRNVDVKAYTAWKDRRFVFNDDLLEEVIHKLGRWYDVEFFLRDAEVRKIRFTGNLPKYRNLDQVLNKLELTTHIRFVQNGRAIEVFTE